MEHIPPILALFLSLVFFMKDDGESAMVFLIFAVVWILRVL